MITQVYYSHHYKYPHGVWSTTYSDKFYSAGSRKHLMTITKPTKRQVRRLSNHE